MAAPVSPRLRTLVVKKGLALGLLGIDERQLIVAFAACQFEAGQAYPEKAVNAVLVDWLAGSGAMLRTDHAELRRWLVDMGFLERDGFGRAYARVEATLAPFIAELGGATAAELSALATEEKAAWQASRDARRRSHESRAS
jgi:hypothetical protein